MVWSDPGRSFKALGTNRTGLNEKEAERRLETYGENVFKRTGRNALVGRYF